MAKKTRTPTPPRKPGQPRRPVQAPKVRTAKSKPAAVDDRRRRLILYALAASGFVALGIVVLAMVALGGSSGGGSTAKLAAAAKQAGCTLVNKPAQVYKQGVVHFPLATKWKYNTFPPSGGPHYYTPAVWNFYSVPVNPKLAVHNQEHGGVVLWWGSKVPASTVQQLHDFYDEDPVGMLGTPLAGLGDKVAATAWTGDTNRYLRNGTYAGEGHVMTCGRFDEKAFKAFRDAYRGQGPEGIPLRLDQPGT